MARTDVTLNNIAGFVEQVTTETGTQLIDLKREFGPIFEAYMRDNQWVSQLDWVFGDMERVVDKINYKAIRDTEVDFDPTKKAVGATVKPERVRITADQEKEVAATWYDRDFQLSNGLESVGARITASLFRTPDIKIDIFVADQMAALVDAATGTLEAIELDIDGMDLTAENGKIVFEAMKGRTMALLESGKTNDFEENDLFDRANVKIEISVKVEELLTAYKSSFIDQSGLLNVGVFGSAFRNIGMKTMTNMPEGKHMIAHTRRALMGTFLPSIHTKMVPEAINQVNYMNEINHTYAYGAKEVFSNEVTGIKQSAGTGA